ncbi:MAG TPA: hypothetical protein VGQ06_01325 [Gemmatimonadales bacterium]|jgi:hypothetical protein|nr:hypothetical protein [Gemmatimonadales bacterium]
MKLGLGLIAGLLAISAAPVSLAAQQDIATRLAGRVPPDVAALVQQLAADAAARGLPMDPLIQKAIEGSAKGVPAERVATAVRTVAGQLDAAAAALRDGGLVPTDTAAIAAGAFALNAGLNDRNLTDLTRASRPPYSVATTLRVASTLAAMGVPAAQVVELVTQVIAAGEPAESVVNLPAQVQARVSHGQGMTPAQAAAGLARAAAARANPPGQNKPKPPHP